MIAFRLPKRIKPNSWEHYLVLLERHNFLWRSNPGKFLKYYLEQETLIENLRKRFDERNEVYNTYATVKK